MTNTPETSYPCGDCGRPVARSAATYQPAPVPGGFVVPVFPVCPSCVTGETIVVDRMPEPIERKACRVLLLCGGDSTTAYFLSVWEKNGQELDWLPASVPEMMAALAGAIRCSLVTVSTTSYGSERYSLTAVGLLVANSPS